MTSNAPSGQPPHQPTRDIEAVVHTLCRYIEAHLDQPLSLADIARKSGYSAAHIQKAFVNIVGSSPKAWHAALRHQQLKKNLKSAPNITGAIYDAGYGAPSRVYENLAQNIGMTPRQYQRGGAPLTLHYATGNTRLGPMMIAATERGICFLQFADDAADLLAALKAEFPHAALTPMPPPGEPHFAAWMTALNDYLDGPAQPLDHLPLDLRGTAFQMLVWRYLQTIPPGTVQSYTQVAAAIGKPAAIRAVASACAKNRVAIAIPCHRVLRGDGTLAGYRWGLNRKQALIEHESGIGG